MNVLLIGMKHCGKSTVGAALAARWACPFHDVDDWIEDTHERATGERLNVREIFKTHGEVYFGQVEARAVRDLLKCLDDSKGCNVVALAGRTPMNGELKGLLSEAGLIVYLQSPVEELLARMKRSGIPPFLNLDDPAGDFADLYGKRAPHYERLADVVIDTKGLHVDAVVGLVIGRIEEHAHGG